MMISSVLGSIINKQGKTKQLWEGKRKTKVHSNVFVISRLSFFPLLGFKISNLLTNTELAIVRPQPSFYSPHTQIYITYNTHTHTHKLAVSLSHLASLLSSLHTPTPT